METFIPNVLIALVLASWFLASLLVQMRSPHTANIRSRDRFGLLPRWTFFAPYPGYGDYHLVYRARFADGRLSSWREIPIGSSRHLWSCLWHPEKRMRKAVADLVVAIARLQAAGAEDNVLMLSFPYLTLLNVVSGAEDIPVAATHYQFLVVEMHGGSGDPPKLLVISDFHRIRDGDEGKEIG